MLPGGGIGSRKRETPSNSSTNRTAPTPRRPFASRAANPQYSRSRPASKRGRSSVLPSPAGTSPTAGASVTASADWNGRTSATVSAS